MPFIIEFGLPFIALPSAVIALIWSIALSGSPKDKAKSKLPVPVVQRTSRLATWKPTKKPFQLLADTCKEPLRSETMLPVAKALEAMLAKTEKPLPSENAVRLAVLNLVEKASGVMSDYVRENAPSENRLQLKRIVVQAHDTIMVYRTYRDWTTKTGDMMDDQAAHAICVEFQRACEAIDALRINHQKEALNKLEVELKVLRDSTRR